VIPELRISALQLGWLCFGFGLFTGSTIVLVITNIRRVIKEDNASRR
jgi:hypothetical protein